MSYVIFVLLCLIGGLMYRIRGGFKICFGKKMPLNKWWFAAYVCFLSWYIFGFDWRLQLTAFVAGKLCTSWCGWGRYLGAICFCVINWDDKDNQEINDLIDNLKVKFKERTVWLKEYPRAYGVVGMSLRGGLLTCILGLCFHSVAYMALGLVLGVLYLLGHYLSRLVDDKAGGWNWGEFFTGIVLTGGLLCLG